MKRRDNPAMTYCDLALSSSAGTQHKRTLSSGVRFIASRQSEDGHFASEVSLAPTMRDSYEERSVYIHSYVLQALSSVRAPASPLLELETVIHRAARHVRTLQEESGWWKFYGPHSEEPPDDVDDTSVAYGALLSSSRPFDRQLVEETNSWLVSLERIRSESGLFKTWADASWNEECFDLPDVVVNANVLFLQSMVGRADGQVSEYLARVVRTETYQLLNLYAVSPYAVPFLISRCNYYGAVFPLQGSMGRLARYVLCRQEADGGWGGELDSVLALLTLLNAGHPGTELGRAVKFLSERQQPDGGWASGPFFRDLFPRYYGSRSLTTALCMEALSRLGTYD